MAASLAVDDREASRRAWSAVLAAPGGLPAQQGLHRGAAQIRRVHADPGKPRPQLATWLGVSTWPLVSRSSCAVIWRLASAASVRSRSTRTVSTRGRAG